MVGAKLKVSLESLIRVLFKNLHSNWLNNFNSDYSIYIDVRYTDNTSLYGQNKAFSIGTHNWQFLDGFILPAKPILSFTILCLFRNSHTGTVWFDDLNVKEVQTPVFSIDAIQVTTNFTFTNPPVNQRTLLSTNDGLSVFVDSNSGTLYGLNISGSSVATSGAVGGVFVRDVATESDFFLASGSLVASGGRFALHSVIPPLGLNVDVTYSPSADRISIECNVTDTQRRDRAVTVYFALPVHAVGWNWGDDISTQRTIQPLQVELTNFYKHAVSFYPTNCLCAD